MPDNPVAWTLFGFFAGGALGGWLVLAILTYETWKSLTQSRPRKLRP